MSKVIALFNDYDSLTRALNQLEQADLGDDIVEVVDRGETEEPVRALDDNIVVAPVANSGSGSFAYAFPAHLGLNDFGEASDYFERAVKDGGRLIVMDTHDNEKALKILEGAKANRVFDSSSL
ncbi:MAG: hypothetical protein KC422_25710 [Trueperaceae bacterium]|nr:hypothetical protein [Trueperaceae bacterium]